MTDPDVIHPRPQLTRADWTCLDGIWSFAIDWADVGLAQRWYLDADRFESSILVPYPPESPRSQVSEPSTAVSWYLLEVDSPPPAVGFRRILHFEAIDYRSTIWLNGVHLRDHEGGQTRISVDATNAWTAGDNSLVVRAVDEITDIEQPRGKQDWKPEPHVIWYRRTSGIWRTVWFEDVPIMHISDIVWTPEASFGVVGFELRVGGRIATDAQLQVTLRQAGRILSRSSHSVLSNRLRIQLSVEDIASEPEPEQLLWSPENPSLIDAELLLSSGDAPSDLVQSYLGLRTVGTDDRSFLLNNRPYFLRLALEQGYWPDTHLAAPSNDDLRREVEMIKELGFNGVRVHQKVADPRFLYWCDRLGLLVWADAPASYRFSHVSLVRTTKEWIEIVERDRNHPSIVAWVPFNESWGIPNVSTDPRQRSAVIAIYELLKSLDGTRVVLGNDGWEYVVGDIAGVHDYSHDPAVLRDRYSTLAAARETVANGRTGGRKISLRHSKGSLSIPIVLSEFGGVNLTDLAETWSGYGEAATAGELLHRLRTLFDCVGEESGLAGFCYTQVTDTVQERNGLLTEARDFKADPAMISAIVRGVEAVRMREPAASS